MVVCEFMMLFKVLVSLALYLSAFAQTVYLAGDSTMAAGECLLGGRIHHPTFN